MGRANETAPKFCRGCGAEILIIKTGTFYGRVVVEAEPVWIRQESGGDLFFTADGRAVTGGEVGDAMDDPDTEYLFVYIPHKGRCPNNGKAPRNRQRRPSGYGR